MKRYVYQFLILSFLFVGSSAWSMEFFKKALNRHKQPEDTHPINPRKEPTAIFNYNFGQKVEQYFDPEATDPEPYIERIVLEGKASTIYYRDGMMRDRDGTLRTSTKDKS